MLLAVLATLFCLRRRKTHVVNPHEVDETGDGISFYKSDGVASPYILPVDRESYYGPTSPHMSQTPVRAVGADGRSLHSTVRGEPYSPSIRYSVRGDPPSPVVAAVSPSESISSISGIAPYRPADGAGKSRDGPATIGEEPPLVHEDAGPATVRASASTRTELPPVYADHAARRSA